jgi:hypothetical protein
MVKSGKIKYVFTSPLVITIISHAFQVSEGYFWTSRASLSLSTNNHKTILKNIPRVVAWTTLIKIDRYYKNRNALLYYFDDTRTGRTSGDNLCKPTRNTLREDIGGGSRREGEHLLTGPSAENNSGSITWSWRDARMHLSRSQSYEFELQRQRRKNLQRHG